MKSLTKPRIFALGNCILGCVIMVMSACSPSPREPTADVAANVVSPQMEGAKAPPNEVVSQAPSPAQAIVIDPACLMSVAWFSERESQDIALRGCRPTTQIGAPNEDGWHVFENEQGERIQTQNASTNPETEAVTFDVIDNGGGTLSGKYRVTGTPDGAGVLKVGQFNIVPLS